ncbi:MAG: hydantoinase B/oxoprolinase family protein [Verrucomicrobiales bacterium]
MAFATMEKIWKIRTDTGGTFTDALAFDPQGTRHRLKILSSGALRATLAETADSSHRVKTVGLPDLPTNFFRGFRLRLLPDGQEIEITGSENGAGFLTLAETLSAPPSSAFEVSCGEEAPVLAARILTRTPLGTAFPPLDFRLATTRATNALLERKIAPVVLFTNRGFEDLPQIGDQRRPDLFAIAPELPPPLIKGSFGLPGRLDADGKELEPLDEAEVEAIARDALQRFPCATAAVALMHSHRNGPHEQMVAAVLRKVGFTHIAISSALAPSIKLLHRAQTAIVEAALAPIIGRFLENIGHPTGQSQLWMMNSAGSVLPSKGFAAKDALLSGPAAGVVGATTIARSLGWEKVLTFDMGGTSTDVARIEGAYPYQFEHQVGDARLVFPSIRIETVAAGGGSICRWADGRLHVGPESAGANPGPACYGKGGPLTVTDLNLLLGYFRPEDAPVPISSEPALSRLEELASTVAAATGETIRPLDLAADLRHLAIEIMADAIRTVSLREGADPADYSLVAFGGAGPQHACEVAAALGIRRVAIPADAGLLSANGLHHAPIERIAESLEIRLLDNMERSISEKFESLRERAVSEVRGHAGADVEISIRRQFLTLRLRGQDSTLPIEWVDGTSIKENFSSEYNKQFHRLPPMRPIEVVSLRVVASTVVPAPMIETLADASESGPALLQDGFSTCLIPVGWTYRKGTNGTLMLERIDQTDEGTSTSMTVQTELFRARFDSLVADMGALLVHTALSTNIRERLDFSCALLDPEGRLVVNAPHIPVHLGALGVCVRSVVNTLDLRPGDVVITNHPAFGGSHLPDVTLLAPVHAEDGQLLGYVANRAHHAEIGGLTPGSMPPDATRLAEEGVVIPPTILAREGSPPDWSLAEQIFRSGPWPSRNPAENLADLQGQWTALVHARKTLLSLARHHGPTSLLSAMENIASQARDALVAAFAKLEWTQPREAEECFDNGGKIHVRLRRLEDGRIEIDCSGSADQHPGNFNATPAIATSSVLYVTRLLAGGKLPLNDGLLKPIHLILRDGSILSPHFTESAESCPAVVAGNVETSQHLVNALLKALGLAACSQGTMNNVLFGNESFAHYETLGGGHGATPDRDGISGRHSHMTNTAITDPEILEHRFPVRLRQFALRSGSGGQGERRGGDGLIREYEFLAPVRVSLLGSKRKAGPEGANGGSAGQPGFQEVMGADGAWREVPGVVSLDLKPGERLRVSTPGGGAWGTLVLPNRA